MAHHDIDIDAVHQSASAAVQCIGISLAPKDVRSCNTPGASEAPMKGMSVWRLLCTLRETAYRCRLVSLAVDELKNAVHACYRG